MVLFVNRLATGAQPLPLNVRRPRGYIPAPNSSHPDLMSTFVVTAIASPLTQEGRYYLLCCVPNSIFKCPCKNNIALV